MSSALGERSCKLKSEIFPLASFLSRNLAPADPGNNFMVFLSRELIQVVAIIQCSLEKTFRSHSLASHTKEGQSGPAATLAQERRALSLVLDI